MLADFQKTFLAFCVLLAVFLGACFGSFARDEYVEALKSRTLLTNFPGVTFGGAPKSLSMIDIPEMQPRIFDYSAQYFLGAEHIVGPGEGDKTNNWSAEIFRNSVTTNLEGKIHLEAVLKNHGPETKFYFSDGSDNPFETWVRIPSGATNVLGLSRASRMALWRRITALGIRATNGGKYALAYHFQPWLKDSGDYFFQVVATIPSGKNQKETFVWSKLMMVHFEIQGSNVTASAPVYLPGCIHGSVIETNGVPATRVEPQRRAQDPTFTPKTWLAGITTGAAVLALGWFIWKRQRG
jgi:hypothetical protein